jgi:hypothetical protein
MLGISMRLERRDLAGNFFTNEHGDVRTPHWILLMPAFGLLPFIRSKLGYEIVHPINLFRRVLGFVCLPWMGMWVYAMATQKPLPSNVSSGWFVAFAASSCILSCIIFVKRARGQHRGEGIHSAEGGYSFVTLYTKLPIPLCELVIVPLGLAGVGYLIAHTVSFELGGWLMFACAPSYLILAIWEYRRRLSQIRAVSDDVLRAGVFGSNLHRPRAPAPGFASGGEEYDLAELGGAPMPGRRHRR